MKLVQKVFPAKTTEFELTDVSVRITTKSLMSESSYEVPLAELKPTPSFHRNISPLWLGIAVFFYLFSAVALGGIIYPVEGTERLGFIILFLVVFAFAVRATMVFLNTKMDVVLWFEVDPENWTGRIVNANSAQRSPCQRNDVSTVPI